MVIDHNQGVYVYGLIQHSIYRFTYVSLFISRWYNASNSQV